MAQNVFSVKSKMVATPGNLDMPFLVTAIRWPLEGCDAKGIEL